MAAPEGYKKLAKIGITYKGNYASGTTYSQLDAVYYGGSTYLALIDSPVGVPNNDGANWKYLAQGFPSDINDVELTFTEATSRANIESGETVKTIFGKIRKWFTDMTAAAFAQIITSYPDLMANTVAGYLVDALAVKEGFETVNSNLNNLGILSPLSKKVLQGSFPITLQAGETLTQYTYAFDTNVTMVIPNFAYTDAMFYTRANISTQVSGKNVTFSVTADHYTAPLTFNVYYMAICDL